MERLSEYVRIIWKYPGQDIIIFFLFEWEFSQVTSNVKQVSELVGLVGVCSFLF